MIYWLCVSVIVLKSTSYEPHWSTTGTMLQQNSILIGTAAQDFWLCFRLGRLHLNAGGLCPIRARAIMEYWQIDELLLGNKTNIWYLLKNINV